MDPLCPFYLVDVRFYKIVAEKKGGITCELGINEGALLLRARRKFNREFMKFDNLEALLALAKSI